MLTVPLSGWCRSSTPISDSLVYEPSAFRTRFRVVISVLGPQPPRPPRGPQVIVVVVVVSGGPTAAALAAAAAPPPPPPEADPRRGPQEAPACPPLPSSCRRGGSVRPAAATPKTAAIASALLLARMLSTAGCATTVAEVPTRASMELCMCICPARQPARAARARSEVGRQFEEGESGIPRFQNA